MSFMMIRGKEYICKECKKSLKIEYEGGSQFTQISDMNVMSQRELAQEYGKLEEYNQSGFYFIEVGFCPECAKKLMNKRNLKILEFMDKIFSLQDRVYNTIKEIQESIDLESLIDYEYILDKRWREIPDILEYIERGLKVPKNIRREIKEIFSEEITNLVREKIRNDLKFQEEVKLAQEEFDKIYKKLSIIYSGGKLYYAKDIPVVENLNPYLMTDTSVRVAKEPNIDKVWYFEAERIDMDELKGVRDFEGLLGYVDYEINYGDVKDGILRELKKW